MKHVKTLTCPKSLPQTAANIQRIAKIAGESLALITQLFAAISAGKDALDA